MYFHLNNWIYLAYFREEAILLNLNEDRYYILDQERAQLIKYILEEDLVIEGNEVNTRGETPLQFPSQKLYKFISYLSENHILDKRRFPSPYPYKLDAKPSSSGVSSASWRIPENGLAAQCSPLFHLEAFMILFKAHLTVKFGGFSKLIALIQKTHRKKGPYISPPSEDLKWLAQSLNRVCLLYPVRTKCLEWASAFVLLALKRRWKCNLVVGVQNYPFLAHAWVEANGNIVFDSQEFQLNLSAILKEPFREIMQCHI